MSGRALLGAVLCLAFCLSPAIAIEGSGNLSLPGGSLNLAGPRSLDRPADRPAPSQSGSSKKKQPSSKKSSTKEKKKDPIVRVSGSFSIQTIYDDNILRYPQNWIDDFRRNDPPEKFDIDTYDDLILSPRLFLTFAANPVGKLETRFYAGLITWKYMSNPNKSNDLWLFRLRQSTARRDYVEASYSYSPPSYIKELSDREPYQSRATTPLEWKAFKGVRHGISLGYSKRMWTRWTFWVEGERVLRYYNKPFLENDNTEWNGTLQITWSNYRMWQFVGKYQYSDANAKALDTVEETIETSDDGDGSYERDLYELRARMRPKGIWPIKEFEVKGQYMGYWFTGTKPIWEDALHTGRTDDVYYLELTSGSATLFGSTSFELGYRYSQRTSSIPGAFEGDDAEDKDYKDNRFWLEARYSF